VLHACALAQLHGQTLDAHLGAAYRALVSRVANHPWIDEARAPVRVVAPPSCSDAEVETLFRSCDSVYVGLTHDVAWVMDSSGLANVSAKSRRIVADHLSRNRAVMKAYVAGIAVVVPNALLRGVFTAITWMVPLEFPHAVVDTREAGLRWAERALAARSGVRAEIERRGSPPTSRQL